MSAAVAIYAAGALLALWRTDASWTVRALLATLWPIGPLAFALTVSLLLAASLIAFPLVGAAVAVGAMLWLWAA